MRLTCFFKEKIPKETALNKMEIALNKMEIAGTKQF